jgi:hypothetical protein
MLLFIQKLEKEHMLKMSAAIFIVGSMIVAASVAHAMGGGGGAGGGGGGSAGGGNRPTNGTQADDGRHNTAATRAQH